MGNVAGDKTKAYTVYSSLYPLGRSRTRPRSALTTYSATATEKMSIFYSATSPPSNIVAIAVAANADAVYNDIPKDSYLLSAR